MSDWTKRTTKTTEKRRPGYKWRLLAHTDAGESVELVSDGLAKQMKRDGRVCDKPTTPTKCCLDEVVIDDWFHLEQLSDTHWWLCVGDAHVNVFVRDGKCMVTVERNIAGEGVPQ